ncbi:DUF1641 domain-containing protein [Deinococcus psychrotolerans]|uniref:DUF1641 domain-containing protein n=1 Tax=Deinococcus psychrotolerans TaxID=2489213 RepID=A0A3G8Y9X7_9DEIO|nr:DUF1641 domain-containing protein [Deinococcus psychrotolerans]AZI41713.1 DUF1641 domain-containing protein [Deinococcus psychrotolerans]
MAKYIQYTPKPKTSQEHYADAEFESAEARTESLKLLRELHEAGVLDVLSKLVRGGEGLTSAIFHTLSDEGSLKAIRNVTELGKTLGSLDPQAVGQLGAVLNAGVNEGARSVAQGKGVGLTDLLKLLNDKDVQLALGAVFGLLKGAGRALREARGDTTNTPNQGEFDRHDQIQPTPNAPKRPTKPVRSKPVSSK